MVHQYQTIACAATWRFEGRGGSFSVQGSVVVVGEGDSRQLAVLGFSKLC